jgi:predicted SnoaL-like aldol condensation-catalyzing enzyme
MTEARTARELRNLAIARGMYEDVLMGFDSTHLDRYIAPDYIQHGALAADGREALRAFLDDAKTRWPRARLEIRREFVDGDFVIFHVFGALEPQDRGSVIVDIFRIQGELIQEHWEAIQEIPETLAHSNGMV